MGSGSRKQRWLWVLEAESRNKYEFGKQKAENRFEFWEQKAGIVLSSRSRKQKIVMRSGSRKQKIDLSSGICRKRAGSRYFSAPCFHNSALSLLPAFIFLLYPCSLLSYL
jgi:hypothetical protein